MKSSSTQEDPPSALPVNQLLAWFAIPNTIAVLVSVLYNIVNQFYIGRSVDMLGDAATNVAFPSTITCTAIPLMCDIGGAASFNLSLGSGEKKEATRYAGGAVFMLAAIRILLCLTVRLFLKPLMIVFEATPDILDYSLIYAGIMSLEFPFFILTTGGSNLIRTDGSPRFFMTCTLTGAVPNTILDPLFTFGPRMGMVGAALAVIIGQIISGIMVIVCLTRFKTVRLSLGSSVPVPSYMKAIATLGMVPFSNQMAMMAVQIVMDSALRYYGARSRYESEIPLAYTGTITKMNMISFSLAIGLPQGLQPIISLSYGAGKFRRVQEAYLKAVLVAIMTSTLSSLCFQLIPRQIIGIFGSGSEEYFHFAEQYFRIFLSFTFLNGLQPIMANYFTSIGETAKGIFISLTRQIIFLLSLIVILPMFFGIEGVIYSIPVTDLMATLLALVFATRELRRARGMEEEIDCGAEMTD